MSTNPHDSSVLAAIGPLREYGFALQWLHPRTKRPIGAEWSERPVASIESLRSSHARGNNLSVRLGEPSLLLNGTYLHVLDLDIRIAECAEECWTKLRELFPNIDLQLLACVQSGSGGESRHLYFTTDKPFFGKKLAVSEGKHRRYDHDRKKEVWSYDWEIELFGTGKHVAMPPSIHPDTGKPYIWERPFDGDSMLFGEVPHHISAAAIEAIGAAETAEYEFETREPLIFKPGQMERDLADLPAERLDDYHDWVTLGQALHHQFGAADKGFDLWLDLSKRSEKFDDSKAGLREMRKKWRGFGRNRRKPVTMATVRQWAADARTADLVSQFDDFEEASDGDDFDSLADATGGHAASAGSAGESTGGDQPADDASEFDDLAAGPAENENEADDFAALAGADDDDDDDDLSALDMSPEEKAESLKLNWHSLLHFNEEGGLKPTLHNLRLIVENDIWTRGVTAYNEFTKEIVQRGQPGKKNAKRKNQAKQPLQLDGSSWFLRDPVNGDFWTEDKDNAIRALLEAPETQGGYGIKVPDRDLRAAIDIAGRKNGFHPVREYLSGLEWDGVSRIERLFIDYVGAPDDPYHRSVSRLMLIAGVTRVFEAGHKFDFAVILEGLQGKRKSTFISILAKSWFAELDGDFEDAKQMVELMQGAWILEIPELSGFARADVRHIKAFISRRSDKVRLAYARRAEEYPRQCIFIGSTNDDRYLKDDTGGRRYWPVRCTVEEIDTDRLEREIDQIWAEAVAAYREMRKSKPHGILPLFLDDEEAKVIAARRQESARVESADDALAGRIAAWLDKPVSTGGLDDEGPARPRDETCLVEIWVECLGADAKSYGQQAAQTLGRAMRLVPGWNCWGERYRHKVYGQQRLYWRGDEDGWRAKNGF
jgi:predicted P-loop ATPase